MSKIPLNTIATSVNKYMTDKGLQTYATALIMRLYRTGAVNYINCGYVHHPLVSFNSEIRHLDNRSHPVGLIEEATFEVATEHLEPGSRILLVTDGVAEAENAEGESFGEYRLEQALLSASSLGSIVRRLQLFCGRETLLDDHTAIYISYDVRALTAKGRGRSWWECFRRLKPSGGMRRRGEGRAGD